MAKKIKVIIKAPGAKPYGCSISPSVESLRRRFGGDFKIFRHMEEGCILCAKNEEGLDYNCEYCGRDFRGLMIFCGYSEKRLMPFPEQFRTFKTLNPSLFEAFERGERAARRRMGKLFAFLGLIGAWGWLGFETIRLFCEIL